MRECEAARQGRSCFFFLLVVMVTVHADPPQTGASDSRPRRSPTNWCLGFPSTQTPHKLVPRIPVHADPPQTGASDSRPGSPATNCCLGFPSTQTRHKLVPRIPVAEPSRVSLLGVGVL